MNARFEIYDEMGPLVLGRTGSGDKPLLTQPNRGTMVLPLKAKVERRR